MKKKTQYFITTTNNMWWSDKFKKYVELDSKEKKYGLSSSCILYKIKNVRKLIKKYNYNFCVLKYFIFKNRIKLIDEFFIER